MAVVVERFRVSTSLIDTGDACHRGLSTLHWTEQVSDRHEVSVRGSAAGDLGADLILSLIFAVLEVMPITRGLVKRYTTRQVQAPAGPSDAETEIRAVLREKPLQPMTDLLVRISLSECGGFGTDVTVSGTNLLAARWGAGPLRDAIAKLHQAIETESRTQILS